MFHGYRSLTRSSLSEYVLIGLVLGLVRPVDGPASSEYLGTSSVSVSESIKIGLSSAPTRL